MRPLSVALLVVVLAGCDDGLSDECARLSEDMQEAAEVLEEEGSTKADLYAFFAAGDRFDAAGCRSEVDL